MRVLVDIISMDQSRCIDGDELRARAREVGFAPKEILKLECAGREVVCKFPIRIAKMERMTSSAVHKGTARRHGRSK